MSQFAPIDVRIDEHPSNSWMELDELGLHMCGILYCNRTLSDGFVPDTQLRKFGASGRGAKVVKRLVEKGTWTRGDRDGEPGYWITGYLDHNDSKAEVEARLDAKRAAGKSGGRRSWKVRKGDEVEAPASASASADAQPSAEASAEANAEVSAEPNSDTDAVQIQTQYRDPPVGPPGAPANQPANDPASGPRVRAEAHMTRRSFSERLDSETWAIAAYDHGIAAGLGRPFAMPSSMAKTLHDAIDGHARTRDVAKIETWVKTWAERFARSVSPDSEDFRFRGEHQPKGFLNWLNDGKPGWVEPKPTPHAASPGPQEQPVSHEDARSHVAKINAILAEAQKAKTNAAQ